MKQDKVLVTGGAGFIGSYLVDELVRRGYEVVVVDNLSTGKQGNINPQAQFIRVNIQDLDEIDKDIRYIFHLAAIPRTQYCVVNPVECHEANINGTIRILELARSLPKLKKFILASSCAIYGPQETLPIKETAPINLGTTYALQKYVQELYIKTYTNLYRIPSVILRLFGTYGTTRQSKSGDYPNVLAAFIKQKQTQGHLEVTGDGNQTRDMVHVDDVVNAFIIAMESDVKDGKEFNVGSGERQSINQIAGFFNCGIEYVAPRPGEAKHFCSDISRIMRELNWEPQIRFSEGIKYYLKQVEEK